MMLPQYAGLTLFAMYVFLVVVGPILMILPSIVLGALYINFAKRYKGRSIGREGLASVIFRSYLTTALVYDIAFYILVRTTDIPVVTILWALLLGVVAVEAAAMQAYYMFKSERVRK